MVSSDRRLNIIAGGQRFPVPPLRALGQISSRRSNPKATGRPAHQRAAFPRTAYSRWRAFIRQPGKACFGPSVA